VAVPNPARGQACCAGTGAITPGRLALHDFALVGTEIHASSVLGYYCTAGTAPPCGPSSAGRYVGEPPGQSEVDLEQDIFGAVRLFKRGQVSLLVPFVETRRQLSNEEGFGGGIGDINLAARYDFLWAGQSRFLPGVAALAGVTAPSGIGPDSSHGGLVEENVTGTGAWQANIGLALEKSFGPWLVDLTEVFAWRAPYATSQVVPEIHEALAPQWTTLAAVGYTFPSEAAVAFFASYAIEGAPTVNGVSDSAVGSRRVALVSVSGVLPVTDRLRLQSSIFVNPPLSGFGEGQTAALGMTWTVIWSWI
jgi:hypothetical protein